MLLHASVQSVRLTPDSPQFLEILIRKATAWRISQYPLFTKSINSCANSLLHITHSISKEQMVKIKLNQIKKLLLRVFSSDTVSLIDLID